MLMRKQLVYILQIVYFRLYVAISFRNLEKEKDKISKMTN